MIPIEASSLLTSVVEYFDGSEVIDPVVISNSFSAGMQSRFVSFIIGQLLAAATFAAIASVASQQISRAGEWVTDNFLKNGSSSQQQQPLQNNSPPNGGSNFVAIRKPDFTKLLICVAIDIIGTSSELIPILGEVTDVVWAPIAALLLRSLYGGSNVLLVLEFAEEILPVTDILPLATICWVVDTFFPASDLAKLLQLGVYRLDYLETPPQPSRPNEARGKPDVIDVEYRETKQKQLRSAAVDETNTSSKPS